MAEAVVPDYGLYPYQRQVLHDLLEALEGDGLAGERRVVAHLPTGAGKTRIACHAAAALLARRDADGQLAPARPGGGPGGGLVVWLASSEELCEQAAENLAVAWRALGNRPVAVHRYWGDARLDLASLGEGFLVAGLQKLWAANRQQRDLLTGIGERAAGVIFDEAHQAVAPTYRFVTEQLAAHNPPLLGLTATPGRSLEPGDEDYALAEVFNERKVAIDPRGHGSAVTYLIRQDYLADPEFTPVSVRLEAKVREPGAERDYSRADLEAIGRDLAWKEQVVGLTRTALGRHRRVMVFCPSVRCAEESARAIAGAGFWSESIVAGTPSDERQEIIDAFRSDAPEPMALFNYGVLTAGFDAPRTRCVIVARPTTSLVLYSQMVGRAMRGPRSGGNRRCQVYTVVDTSLRGFGSVVEAFRNWEGLWRRSS